MNAIAERLNAGVYGLKPRFQGLLRPVAGRLVDSGIRANHVTFAACAGSIALGTVLSLNADRPVLFFLLPTFLFIRMAMNALDGIMAREFGQASRLGVYANELGDIVSDAFCLLPFAFVPGFSPVWMGALIFLAAMSETTGILAQFVQASRRYDGPMGKSDRALVFGLIAIWIGAGGTILPRLALAFCATMSLLLAATIWNRASHALVESEPIATPAGEAETITEGPRFLQQRFFQSHDGTRLFYRYWPALQGRSDRAIVLLHRGHEHSGRLAHLADELNLPDFSMFAWDARGHGFSETPADNEPTLGCFVKDLDCFVAHITNVYGIPAENIAIVSQSVGSVLAATWVHDYAPRIRAMVLAAPAFRVKLYVPFAKTALRLMHRRFGDFRVNSYVRPAVLTHDALRIASYKSDTFITRPISVRVLLGLYGTSDRIVQDAQAIQLPTQLLCSGKDWVVHNKPQFEFFERLGSKHKEKHVFHDFYHDILGEKDRSLALEKVRNFLLSAFSSAPQFEDLRDADQHGVTRNELEAMNQPLPMLSPRRMAYGVLKFGTELGGRFSDGMRVGLESGFDSGASLEYVYRNQPSGIWPLGPVIDRAYLNAVGWRGIRTRKENLVLALRQAITRLNAAGTPVRIVDIAAGQGRYIFEAIANLASIDDLLLRDYADLNVQCGSEFIRRQKLGSFARFEKGDAFDRASLAQIAPKRTVGVVSGLYELFPENAAIRNSLAGLADAIAPDGYLLYTCQPYHPQLELIARTLTNRDGKPWVMRRRTQAEMDQLVAEAGFQKLQQWIDEDGIFSVSLAQKVR
jgi:alpha-beta hydrolase superfamily lysophospholipase/phosphatidylglycerophosphate synthase